MSLSKEYMLALKSLQGIGTQKLLKIGNYIHDDFPSVLKDTINEDGKLDPPMVLYYKGDFSITNTPQLAVIGTRELTDFGQKAGAFLLTQHLKFELPKKTW